MQNYLLCNFNTYLQEVIIKTKEVCKKQISNVRLLQNGVHKPTIYCFKSSFAVAVHFVASYWHVVLEEHTIVRNCAHRISTQARSVELTLVLPKMLQ